MWSDGPAGSADDSRGAVGWVDIEMALSEQPTYHQAHEIGLRF